MNFSIVHLSDLHLKKNSSLDDKINNIKEIIKLRKNIALLILIVTGDIAYSGDKEEYILVKEIFEKIRKDIPNIKICIVPGNHDCRFSKKSEVRNVLINNCCNNISNKVSDDIIEEILKVQNEFVNFKKQLKLEEKKITSLHHYSKFKIGNYTIVINHLNTAWMSSIEEKQGQLFFPIEELNFKEKGNFNITIFHHNFNWFIADNAREFKKIVEKNSELILSGHEHQGNYEKRDGLKTSVQHLEGYVLQDSYNNDNSGFSIIDIDLKKMSIMLWEYSYDINTKAYKGIENKIEFTIKNSILEYEITKKFEDEFLYDVGANFHHPRKRGKLVLEDLYIYPDFKRINFNKENKKDVDIDKEYINSIFLKNLNKEKKDNKFLIIGDEKSGKTTLAKMLYTSLRDKEFIPLYVNIDTKNTDNVEKILRSNFSNQYNKNLYEKYIQENIKKKFIIIDNFEKIKNKVEFLKKIETLFDNIFILGNLLVEIDNVFYNKILSKDKKYQKFKIEEFGNKLRYLLIEKWNKLGIEYEERELQRKNEEAMKIINMSIGKNIVPSYPIFILTSLQMLETRAKQNFDNSTQGYYYQFLITESISRFTKDDFDTYFNFLSELSFEMFKTKNLILSREKLYDFHNKFKEKYSISPYFKEMINFDILLNNFEKNNILATDYNGSSFKYKYIYYFFISKYLSNKINDFNVQNEIEILIDTIYQEESANIILFLTHHTKNDFIIKKLLKKCQTILNDFTLITLTDDVIKINELVDKLPTFKLPEKVKPKKNKLENYKRQDKLERTYSDTYDKEESPEDVLELAKNLNLAFKSIEIIGNILKSYHGSLEKEIKLNLAKEAYYLGLRATGFIFDLISNDIEMTTKRIEDFLLEKNIDSNYKKREMAKRFIFDFSSFVAFSFLEKTASSLAFDKLSLVFDLIQDEHKNNNGIKLINLMMELAYKKSIPLDTMKNLKNELKNNNIASYLLKTTIIKFLYFTSLNYSDRQKICSLFDIKPMKSIERNVKIIKNS